MEKASQALYRRRCKFELRVAVGEGAETPLVFEAGDGSGISFVPIRASASCQFVYPSSSHPTAGSTGPRVKQPGGGWGIVVAR